jgi:hypothetical protein
MTTHQRCAPHQLADAALLFATAFAAAGCGDLEWGPNGAFIPSAEATGSGLFTAPNAWSLDVSALATDPSSSAVVQWIAGQGGWGTGALSIDFSMNVLHADASAPFLDFDPTSDFYVPDCDHVPFPVPPGGALEGEDGYACTNGGDCHLLVVDDAGGKLYEMWRADLSPSGTFSGGCAAVWDLAESYGASLRGEDCASADAGGLPVAALLFTADEVAAGAIDHAIRFMLPNERIRPGVYVHPATHTTAAVSGGLDAPPYGVRLRLRADYPIDALSPGAQVIAAAMQRYGMILADGGDVALTAEGGRFTSHTWADVGVDAQALAAIAVTDMEVVALETPITYSGDCVRQP